jgi:hypothetical protein
MSTRRIGFALIALALIAPVPLAVLGFTLGQFTVFNVVVDDQTILTKSNFDPNWPVVIPIGMVALVGAILLLLSIRRRRRLLSESAGPGSSDLFR